MMARAWIFGVASVGLMSVQLSVERMVKFNGFIDIEASLPYLPFAIYNFYN
jgi:hypothetical protein